MADPKTTKGARRKKATATVTPLPAEWVIREATFTGTLYGEERIHHVQFTPPIRLKAGDELTLKLPFFGLTKITRVTSGGNG